MTFLFLFFSGSLLTGVPSDERVFRSCTVVNDQKKKDRFRKSFFSSRIRPDRETRPNRFQLFAIGFGHLGGSYLNIFEKKTVGLKPTVSTTHRPESDRPVGFANGHGLIQPSCRQPWEFHGSTDMTTNGKSHDVRFEPVSNADAIGSGKIANRINRVGADELYYTCVATATTHENDERCTD